MSHEDAARLGPERLGHAARDGEAAEREVAARDALDRDHVQAARRIARSRTSSEPAEPAITESTTKSTPRLAADLGHFLDVALRRG